MDVKQAFDVIKDAIRSDEDYAHGWHCNLAMAANDEGMELEAAQRSANRFMILAFRVRTHPAYQVLQDDDHEHANYHTGTECAEGEGVNP